jgi:hypothetical protein
MIGVRSNRDALQFAPVPQRLKNLRKKGQLLASGAEAAFKAEGFMWQLSCDP